MDPSELEYLEKLTALKLDAEERQRLATQLENVLAYVRAIESVDTSSVEPTSHVLEQPAPLRPDVVTESYSQDLAMREGAETEDGFFIVPPVMRASKPKDRA